MAMAAQSFSGRIINAPLGSSRVTWSIAQKNEGAQYFTSTKSYRGAQRGRCRQAYFALTTVDKIDGYDRISLNSLPGRVISMSIPSSVQVRA